MQIVSQLQLKDRTLRISPTFAGFEYQDWVCEKRLPILGCIKRKMQVDRYDLNDPAVRKQLIDMGFVARVERE